MKPNALTTLSSLAGLSLLFSCGQPESTFVTIQLSTPPGIDAALFDSFDIEVSLFPRFTGTQPRTFRVQGQENIQFPVTYAIEVPQDARGFYNVQHIAFSAKNSILPIAESFQEVELGSPSNTQIAFQLNPLPALGCGNGLTDPGEICHEAFNVEFTELKGLTDLALVQQSGPSDAVSSVVVATSTLNNGIVGFELAANGVGPAVLVNVGANPVSLAVGNFFSEDGTLPEIAVAVQGENQVKVVNTSSGEIVASLPIENPTRVLAKKLDGDLRPELIVADRQIVSIHNAILSNPPHFEQLIAFPFSGTLQDIMLDNINNDGFPDDLFLLRRDGQSIIDYFFHLTPPAPLFSNPVNTILSNPNALDFLLWRYETNTVKLMAAITNRPECAIDLFFLENNGKVVPIFTEGNSSLLCIKRDAQRLFTTDINRDGAEELVVFDKNGFLNFYEQDPNNILHVRLLLRYFAGGFDIANLIDLGDTNGDEISELLVGLKDEFRMNHFVSGRAQ